jgi:plastocyanin
MPRVLLLAVAAVALTGALLGASVGTSAPAQNPKLHAKVDAGFTITLTDDAGAPVTKLDPGTYDIEVEDETSDHNFHLIGPGVNRSTTVAGVVKQVWTVTFTDGVYTFQCDPHSTSMRGTFTVGNPSTQPPPPPSGGAITAKSRLVLTSGPGFSITLKTTAGKTVRTMKRGTYRVTVRDRASVHNAHIVAPGYNRRTTPLSYVGTQTWSVRLAKTGTLRFLCDPHARAGMRGSAKIVG